MGYGFDLLVGGDNVTPECENADEDRDVHQQGNQLDTIMLREPTQRWPVVGRRRKYAGHEQAQRKKKAEPIDELIGVGAQMRVDLLVFLQQQRRSLDHQVTEPGRRRPHADPCWPARNGLSRVVFVSAPRQGGRRC
jgi:hypothetical protein